jgi:exosortase
MTTAPLLEHRAGRRVPAGAAVIALLGAAVYTRTFAGLWETWTHNDNYSHGPLVPLVAAAMAWSRRHALAGTPVRGDARGLALIGVACALQIAGLRADVLTLQGWSVIAMVFGLSLTFLGAAMTRQLAFPLAYLTFMLTFPPVFVNRLSFALKEVAMRLSAGLAEALGATFQRNGMVLHLATGELRVENPCSGLRSLIALLATGAAFAFFQPGAWWRGAALVAAAIPIAVAANAARLTALILVAHYGDVERATGTFHDWSGTMIYVAALAGLMGARALLTPRAPADPREEGVPVAVAVAIRAGAGGTR